MLWPERPVQDHKLRTDRAIHRAYAQLACDPSASATFRELLHHARTRAPRLFEAPIVDSRHIGVEALVNLSLTRSPHVRSPADWSGTASSWRVAVASLARHLFGQYPVPQFLASAWYSTAANAPDLRRWFLEHSCGVSFRSLNLPIAMTRMMEHIFLASQHHLTIEHALRRAELLGLGASPALTQAVMATHLAHDLRNGDFWRTVLVFFVNHSNELDLQQVGPIIDYIQAVRFPPDTPGLVNFGAIQPAFSIKGRSVPSLLRLVNEWHKNLGHSTGSFSWTPAPFKPMLVIEPPRDESEQPRRWQLSELTSQEQLRREGSAMRHCVASYAYACLRGGSSIWALRLWREEHVQHVITIEVDPKRRKIIQARGKANARPTAKPMQLLHEWAQRERLEVAI
ncbi:MAG: PcfJ domain-containing protein [Acidobacteriaceae bacterium]|nr:PcfJ domain-containing protein [Acidobacteriaceae bacterium]